MMGRIKAKHNRSGQSREGSGMGVSKRR